MKEETAKRSEKEIKKMEPVTAKKPEPSVSPKKLQVSSLPITRHRVSLNSILIIKSMKKKLQILVMYPYIFLFYYIFDRFMNHRPSLCKILVFFSVLQKLVAYSFAVQENRGSCLSNSQD